MTWDEFLSTITYKPNITFKFKQSYINSLYQEGWLVIEVTTKDTYNPDIDIVVTHQRPVHTTANSIEMSCILRDAIHLMECHEADEWLRIQGEMIFNPHKDEARL